MKIEWVVVFPWWENDNFYLDVNVAIMLLSHHDDIMISLKVNKYNTYFLLDRDSAKAYLDAL